MSKVGQRKRAFYDYGYLIGLGKARYDTRRGCPQSWEAFEQGRAAGIRARQAARPLKRRVMGRLSRIARWFRRRLA